MALDLTMAAVKLFISELSLAKQKTNAFSLFGGVLFQRAWLQGYLVAKTDDGRFVLDDGSDVIDLFLPADFQSSDWKVGMYVMVVGPYLPAQPENSPYIKVQKIVDLSSDPNRESMWNVEVIEAHELFYFNKT